MKTIKKVDVKDKKVLIRADLNVSLNKDNNISDDFRIKASLPTINYLREQRAKIILMSHLGRPNGKVEKSLRLDPVQKKLSQDLGILVKKINDCIGFEALDASKNLNSGEILLLENLRFHLDEEKNDENFARQLAELGDIYVNDAFGACHRAHASVVGITKFLPSYAGFLLHKEINVLSKITETPARPLTVVLGGAKISTKIKLIQEFLGKADNIILGGALANTALHAKGIAIGKSFFEEEMVIEVQKFDITNTKMHMPVDAVVSTDRSGDKKKCRVAPIGNTKKDEMILDIGPDTEKLYDRIIQNSKTIIWNGPMGLFEIKAFNHGTRAIAESIIRSSAFSVAGGGETITFLNEVDLFNKFSHVSSGGGAMMEFLAGNRLPGLEALGYYD